MTKRSGQAFFSLAREVAACAFFFGCVVSLQYFNGSLKGEFGGDPDEAAHFVTGLMVHDYLVGHHLSSPIQFAKNYYLHYPKVSIGHWPPVFYMLQAFWTLVFPPSRLSLMILMAILTSSLAYAMYRFLRADYGETFGIVTGLLFIALPLCQAYSGMVMAEVPLALFSFLAALCFAKFLKSGNWKHAAGFGCLASLTILVKGSGFALALVPPLAVLFSRRLRLVLRFKFWLPAIIVSLLCLPWFWVTRGMVQNTWIQPESSITYTFQALHFYGSSLVSTLGAGLLVLSAVGITSAVIVPMLREGAAPEWAALMALVVAFWTTACVVPVGLDTRFLIPIFPALLTFMAPGCRSIANHISFFRSRWHLMSFVLLLIFAADGMRMAHTASSGYGDAANFLVSSERFKGPILVASDAEGEGMMVSEIALHEPRPGHYVLRASKILAEMNWMGSEYRLVYRTPEELMKFLKSGPIRIVVYDGSVNPKNLRQHQSLLRNTILANKNRWQLVAHFPVVRLGIRQPEGIRIYMLADPVNHHNAPIQIDMQRMLGKTLELRP